MKSKSRGEEVNWNWNETSITLAYTPENLKDLLNKVCNKENSFSQFDFSKWCDNLTMFFDDDEREELNEYETLAAWVATDIEAQWDLFLINTYSSKILQDLDLTKVELPHQWWIQWSEEMNEAL